MLDGLEEIRWDQLTHAYGKADGIPARIRALQSTDPAQWVRAISDLYDALCHQMCSIYPATVSAIPFFIQPLVAVFYPVAALPGWLRPITQIFPATHIFEGMRDVLNPEVAAVSWSRLGAAVGLNIIFMALAAFIFASILKATRQKGLLTKFATQ